MHPKITLVQEVRGCGKTTYILKHAKKNDLISFATREGVEDFRSIYRCYYPNDVGKAAQLTYHIRTLHSCIINYKKMTINYYFDPVFLDEALMKHCRELLASVCIANCKEHILLRETQISLN